MYDLICEQGRKDRVIWFSLVEEINQALRRYDPTIPTIVSVASMLKVGEGIGTGTGTLTKAHRHRHAQQQQHPK